METAANRRDNDAWQSLCKAVENGNIGDHHDALLRECKDMVTDNGCTLLHIAAETGRETLVKKISKSGVPIDKANNQGETPLLIAIQKGHEGVVTELINEKADINKKNNDGDTPLSAALKSRENPCLGKILREKTLQNDREQVTNAHVRSKDAISKMSNLNGQKAIKDINKLQSKLHVKYAEIVLPTLVNTSDDCTNGRDSQKKKKSEIDGLCDEIIKVVENEEKRLGDEVIQVCLNKYKARKERWATLENLQDIEESDKKNRQPIGNSRDSGNLLRINEDINHKQGHLLNLIFMSKFYNPLFKQQMNLLIDKVNNATNPEELGLDDEDCLVLPFIDVFNGKDKERANLTFAEIKKPERAFKKAEVYGKS